MGQGMRRFKQGVRNPDGTFKHYPGERVLPEPECLRQQNETEKIKWLMQELGVKFVSREMYLKFFHPKKKLLTASL